MVDLDISPNFLQSGLAGKMSFHAFILCEPEKIRTSNLLIRSQVHYPVMLRVLDLNSNLMTPEAPKVKKC